MPCSLWMTAPALLLVLAGCGARSELPIAGGSPVQQQSPTSILLFGGLADTSGNGDLGDTWVWTVEGGWVEREPPASPSPRFGAMAATLGGSTVLFGGDGETAETWIWDGATWAQREPGFSPPPLTSSVLVPMGQGLVLFAGYDYGVLYQDVWTWDGTDWAHQSPSMVPPPREGPAGAVLDGSLVVFGGEDVNLEPLGDTWVYDGTNWTEMHPAHSPSPRRGAVAAALDGKVVLFGGDTVPPSYGDWLSVNETWVWDGTDWTQQEPAESPDARSFAGMAAAAGRVVLFGGGTFGGSFEPPAGTWIWDGATWTRGAGPDPSPRNEPAMGAR